MASRSSKARVTAEVRAAHRRETASVVAKEQSTLAKMRRRRATAKVTRAAKRQAAVVPRKPTARPEKAPATASRGAKRVAALKVMAKVKPAKDAPPVLPATTPSCPASLTVVVPAGIGDVSWLLSKLLPLGCRLRVRGTTAGPPRLRSLLDIVPGVSVLPAVRMSFSTLRKRSLKPRTSKSVLFTATGEQHMEANTWLEGGRKLANWLPEFATDYHYPLTISDEAVQTAEALLPNEPFVCIFPGNNGTAKNWSAWFAPEWTNFMQAFRTRIAPVKFVLIGAAWDTPMADNIAARAKAKRIPVVNLVAKLPLASSLHVIKRSAYFLAFPSGMGVLANVMSQPATMFYPGNAKQLRKMPKTWSDPASAASNEFNEIFFDDPDKLVAWLVDVYAMKGRL